MLIGKNQKGGIMTAIISNWSVSKNNNLRKGGKRWLIY